jgi:hypothetical protein
MNSIKFQFKVYAMSFNIFIQMKLNLQKNQFILFINWLSLVMCNSMEPKLLIEKSI